MYVLCTAFKRLWKHKTKIQWSDHTKLNSKHNAASIRHCCSPANKNPYSETWWWLHNTIGVLLSSMDCSGSREAWMKLNTERSFRRPKTWMLTLQHDSDLKSTEKTMLMWLQDKPLTVVDQPRLKPYRIFVEISEADSSQTLPFQSGERGRMKQTTQIHSPSQYLS